MNVADYVIDYLEKKGVNTIFQVPGGGAMYLNDAVAKSTKIKPVFCHHEQACAMAAVGYAKVSNKPGVTIVTSGCAGTNTLTGVLDAWQDSHPMIIISGQANLKETSRLNKANLRKLGVQEVDIIEIVTPITKHAVMVEFPKYIDIILEKAWLEATTGRPGPVWIDIPLDVQSKEIPEDICISPYPLKPKQIKSDYSKFEELLKNSLRPIVIAGNGIKLSNTQSQFKSFIEKTNIPYVTTFLGINVLKNHQNDIGRIGIKGNRAANFAVANSDLVIVLGSSLSVPATGFQYHLFAREAKVVVIDIDEEEHSKDTVSIDTFIKADLSNFFELYSDIDHTHKNFWLGECLRWKEKWDNFDRPDINKLNMYSFSKKLSEVLSLTNVEKNVVTDAGSAYYVIAQTLQNANIILPSSQGEMGFMIPAAIGSYYANPNALTIGVTGEGSFQFNIQELQTIVHNNLPITLIVLNNGGYLSIRNTQNKFFNSRLSGESKDSGVSFPNLKKIAKAYGIKFKRIKTIEQLEEKIDDLIYHDAPVIIEIMCPSDEVIYPTSATQQMEDGSLKSQPLENMFPFLSKEEFETEMIVGIFQ